VFWDALLEKVRRGAIEVADDVEHNARDLPLVDEQEALTLVASHR
jgi:hypothetical protein